MFKELKKPCLKIKGNRDNDKQEISIKKSYKRNTWKILELKDIIRNGKCTKMQQHNDDDRRRLLVYIQFKEHIISESTVGKHQAYQQMRYENFGGREEKRQKKF